MKLSKRQLKRIIREEYSRLKRRGLIKESMPEEGSIEDIINMCVRECEQNPDADVERVCEKWLEMYGIPYNEYAGVIEAVFQRL